MGGGSKGGGGHGSAKDYPLQYFAASAGAALINYPLWRVSAIGQSGFHVPHTGRFPSLAPYIFAMSPPYKGALATVFGMTWARAAIFYGSDAGRDLLRNTYGCSEQVAIVVPPLVVSTLVQFVNMPVVRATVTIQDPGCTLPNVWSSFKHIYSTHGVDGLWHGTSAGVLKTVPKYVCAIVVKDAMEAWLQDPNPSLPPADYKNKQLLNSAIKAITAGVAGAALTNPLDVIRNEMFKTNHGLFTTWRNLREATGWDFLKRGMGKNIVAVALPGMYNFMR